MLNLFQKIERVAGDSIVIPDSVWECEDLKPIDIKVYRLLLKYTKSILSSSKGKVTKDGEPIINVAMKTLYIKLGINSGTLDSSLKRLEGVRLIHVDRYNGFKKNNHILVLGDFFDFDEVKTDSEVCDVAKKEIIRIPIILPSKKKYLEKLRSIGGSTRQEKEILSIAQHYEMLVRKMNRMGGYSSLSKNNPTEHKNWSKFEKLFNLCDGKGWEPRYYLDAQFDKADKYWKNSKFKFPLPQMLCSKASQEYFEKWTKEREEIYAEDLHSKEKLRAQKTLSLKQQVIRDIVRSTEMLSMYCNHGTDEEREQSKALRIYDVWSSYSSAYLYSIPWFKSFLKELDMSGSSHPRLPEVKKDFELFDKNKKIQMVIQKTVNMCENEFSIPANLAI